MSVHPGLNDQPVADAVDAPTNPFKVLVCGGRDFQDMPAVVSALDAIHRTRPITWIIEGGAAGADRCAYRWAKNNGLEGRTYRADWAQFGRAAGPIRNDQMLTEGNPDLVVAFPGGTGTAHLVRMAKRSGVAVWHPLSGAPFASTTDGATGPGMNTERPKP